jgi:hypothetical protein
MYESEPQAKALSAACRGRRVWCAERSSRSEEKLAPEKKEENHGADDEQHQYSQRLVHSSAIYHKPKTEAPGKEHRGPVLSVQSYAAIANRHYKMSTAWAKFGDGGINVVTDAPICLRGFKFTIISVVPHRQALAITCKCFKQLHRAPKVPSCKHLDVQASCCVGDAVVSNGEDSLHRSYTSC